MVNIGSKIVFVLLGSAAALSGCIFMHGSIVIIGKIRPATKSEDITIYTELPANYQKIAMAAADSRNNFDQSMSETALEQLKKEAARVGANGLLLNGFDNYIVYDNGIVKVLHENHYTGQGFISMNTRRPYGNDGLAVYVPYQ